MILDDWSFDRAEAAHIVGLSEVQIANWVNRFDFLADRPGRGISLAFRFKDLIKLAAIKLLIESKLCEPKNAVRLVDHGSLYGLLRDLGNPVPGFYVVSRTKDGLFNFFDPNGNADLQVRIDLWSLCDSILPSTFETVRTAPGKCDPEWIEAQIQEAQQHLDQFRPRQQG